MKKKWIKMFFVFFITLFSAISLVKVAGAINLAPEEVEVIENVNEKRSLNELNPLSHNAQLSTAARAHSEDMATHVFLSHIGSDGSTAWERVADAGYTGTWRGECIGHGYTAASWVDALMASDTYRPILMDPIANRIGVGYQSSYWTLEIGSGGSIDPVPVPSALLLLGTGLFGLGAVGWRRRQV